MSKKLVCMCSIVLVITFYAAAGPYDPVLYNLPVFDLELNAQNVIPLNAYFLLKPTEIRDISFKYNKTYCKDINYNPGTREMIINTAGKSGITVIHFSIKTKKRTVSQLFFARLRQAAYTHSFTYKSEDDITVSVAGEFNNWNATANVMQKKDGFYSTTMSLEPGVYKYKFVVNGDKWIPDPDNPDKTTDGWDNSLLTVGQPLQVDYTVAARGERIRNNGIDLVLQATISSLKPVPSTLYCLFNNRLVTKIPDIKSGPVTVHIDKKMLSAAYASELNNAVYSVKFVIVTGSSAYFEKSYILESSGGVFNWKDTLLYFLFTDRFYNYKNTAQYKVIDEHVVPRTNYHGGNFKGITKKIQDGYFKRIGMNALWISPVNQNPKIAYHEKYTGYHGYWPVDSYAIADNFGTMADLKKMVRTAHQNGIKILIDFVANHVHEEHPLYKKHPEYFGTLQLPDGTRNIGLFDRYPMTTWFTEFLPSFDYSQPGAVDYMVKNAIWLIKESGADGFRLDAVKHIPHIFWKKLRETIKYEIEIPRGKIFYMVGETMDSRETIMSFVNPGEINGQFDFPLYWDIRAVIAANQDGFKRLNNGVMDSLAAYGSESLMSTMLGNHDFSRFMAYADNTFKPDSVNEQEYGWKHHVTVDDPENYRKLTLGFTFLMTIPGIPLVYYGDEFGMTGAHDPDNRRDMRFGDELSPHERQVLDRVRRLARVRRENSVFRYGDVVPLKVEDEVYAYLVTSFEQKAVVVLARKQSFSGTITLPEWLNISTLKNAVTGKELTVNNQSFNVHVDKYSGSIFIGR